MPRCAHEEAADAFTVWRAFAESLVFPLRPRARWLTVGIPLAIWFAFGLAMGGNLDGPELFALFSCPLPLAVVMTWWGLTSLLKGAAEGPPSGRFRLAGGGTKVALHFLVVVAAPLVAGLVLFVRDDFAVFDVLPWEVLANPVFLAYLVTCYPMSLAIVVASGRLRASLNPIAVARSAWAIRWEYVLVVLFILVLGGGTILSVRALSRMGAPVAYISPWIAYYATSVIVSRLGFMAYRNRYRLGWR